MVGGILASEIQPDPRAPLSKAFSRLPAAMRDRRDRQRKTLRVNANLTIASRRRGPLCVSTLGNHGSVVLIRAQRLSGCDGLQGT